MIKSIYKIFKKSNSSKVLGLKKTQKENVSKEVFKKVQYFGNINGDFKRFQGRNECNIL